MKFCWIKSSKDTRPTTILDSSSLESNNSRDLKRLPMHSQCNPRIGQTECDPWIFCAKRGSMLAPNICDTIAMSPRDILAERTASKGIIIFTFQIWNGEKCYLLVGSEKGRSLCLYLNVTDFITSRMAWENFLWIKILVCSFFLLA